MTSVLYDAPGPKARRLSRIISVLTALVVIAALAGLIWTLAAPRTTVSGAELPGYFDATRWNIFDREAVWIAIGRGVWGTLSAAGVAAVLALAFGVVLSLLRASELPAVRIPTTIVLEFIRGVPVLLMMLFILLVAGSGAYWAVVGALALYNGAIIGEALRAGIRSLPRGQREAGLSLGLSGLRTRFLIEFPQAFRQMLPIIIAQLVVLLKDTSLGYVVAYPEILFIVGGNMPDSYGSRYQFTFFVVTIAIYLAINLAVSALARFMSRRRIPLG
ncbi:amino acid ABC transporter permease [Arenivirga flava]|uniref:Amino acid ABC transporter permease n=1 Tax=Arenivirga flava TaxID=1930060 RepID=A0AA37UHN5_9MICO|nr:ABC transporter permease subunit [Arenivirga flava]GMA27110.1 amino acid ABC transporter permease [Arenivirga flava]